MKNGTMRGRGRLSAACVLAVVVGACGGGEPDRRDVLEALEARPEATDFVETSRYADVMDFLETVVPLDDRMHLTTFGYTTEGRALPMVVVGAPNESPDAVRATGKLRVYLQGGIHSGEVPGKESLQMLLREIAQGRHDALLDEMVLLIAPIYNADGNERVALDNRPLQHGPIGGMGQRPNAMGLDLNRDHMKLDAPESRALTRMLTAYDPHVGVDLHTTNGTRHGYHLTYSPPLHPDTPESIDALLRDRWFPETTERMLQRTGWHTYYYGNVFPPGPDEEPGWATFDARPRFGTNYVGLRNRFAILSEAYSYLTLRDRIEATRIFVEEVLGFAQRNADAIAEAVDAADALPIVGQEVGIRSELERSAEPVDILMGAVDTVYHPYSGAPMHLRRDETRTVQMYEWGSFAAVHSVVAPEAYYLPPDLADVVERLRAHGVEVEAVEGANFVGGEAFGVTSATSAEQPFQGRVERTLGGAWRPETVAMPEGTVRVPVAQPLGRLVVHLLEPEAEDGFANWGLLDAWIAVGEDYPIVRGP